MAFRARARGFFLAFLVAAVAARPAAAQETVDRIVARVENDIILLSDIRDLGAYQMLVQGKKEPDARLLDRLIDQGIVRTEAEASGYPRPAREDVDAEVEKLKTETPAGASFEERLRENGLTEADVRRMVESQLYLTGYLDSRFRPAVQVDQKDVEDYYQKTVVPLARTKGQEPPSLESSQEWIHELLVQQKINEQADRWLKERRSRLHVEKMA
ncbi:MAG TPA: hypothetical protein VEH49_04120 [Methylomirabilota bacterium]|nr:hypothetical protein [Methylomirabilota bacterium]